MIASFSFALKCRLKNKTKQKQANRIKKTFMTKTCTWANLCFWPSVDDNIRALTRHPLGHF